METAMPKRDERCLLDILGGESGCLEFARDFYARVATDEVLKPLFPGKSFRCATEEFSAFLIQFLDGDPDQTQYRWWLSLRESHARFEISARQRMAWLRHMRETIRSKVGDPDLQHALEQFFGVTSAYLVGGEEAAPEHPELYDRWCRQRALDQLIQELVNGSDSEAIALARRFALQPAVFVGILARMMRTARVQPIDFVLESINHERDLAKAMFSGRTLLHFAAGNACLPVVRLILSLGVDPDVPDRGGHTPLYRAAGSPFPVDGPSVVRELVQAGASIDHGGGVNRSTPLHEAARHGRFEIAEMLLKLGANPEVRDKNGFTPLLRAQNCRKQDVAKLLAARR